jgi:hypothetical protein
MRWLACLRRRAMHAKGIRFLIEHLSELLASISGYLQNGRYL